MDRRRQWRADGGVSQAAGRQCPVPFIYLACASFLPSSSMLNSNDLILLSMWFRIYPRSLINFLVILSIRLQLGIFLSAVWHGTNLSFMCRGAWLHSQPPQAIQESFGQVSIFAVILFAQGLTLGTLRCYNLVLHMKLRAQILSLPRAVLFGIQTEVPEPRRSNLEAMRVMITTTPVLSFTQR